MAKTKSRKECKRSEKQTTSKAGAEGQRQIYDPGLVSLFAQSLGAVKSDNRLVPWSKSHPTTIGGPEASKSESNPDGGKNSCLSETSLEQLPTNLFDISNSKAFTRSNDIATAPSRKRMRMRKDAEDDLESRYMSQLAGEEVKEEHNRAQILRLKRQKGQTQEVLNADRGSPSGDGASTSDPEVATDGEEESAMGVAPQHEDLITSRADLDMEKSSRTVFLANVSTMAIKSRKAKRTLMDHLASFTSSLPPRNGGHDIESLRFRSIPFAASGVPKRAAFAKKEIMDTTTKSTNAYVVYTTQPAAREAVARLNGSIVLDRHLRVDSVAHPAKIDHRRCVFVGNLGFVDDETGVKAAQDEEVNKRPRKAREAADVEEGLWRLFEKAGLVESVRVVRDKTTRVGKGFAYVQFKDANSVERALLYHQKKFPPMLPRILRVTRAKNTKNAPSGKEGFSSRNVIPTEHRRNVSSQVQSLTGRAHKLLGRAGAAKLRATRGQHMSSSRHVSSVSESSRSITFEGFRASISQGEGTIQAARRKRRPSNRSIEFRVNSKRKAKL